jgi:hypothetical protein
MMTRPYTDVGKYRPAQLANATGADEELSTILAGHDVQERRKSTILGKGRPVIVTGSRVGR